MSENQAKNQKIIELDETAVRQVSGGGFLRGSLYDSLATNNTHYGFKTTDDTGSTHGRTLDHIVSKTYFCDKVSS